VRAANYLGHPEPFEISQIGSGMMDDKEHFDIFTHHTRFHAANVRSVMPADTKKITILREPASLFESLYNFFRVEKIFKAKYDLATLLAMTDIENLTALFDSTTRRYRKIGRNQVNIY
jgi:Galactose-3-O-sulfotransferase